MEMMKIEQKPDVSKFFIKVDENGNIIGQGSVREDKIEKDHIIVDKLPEEDIYKYVDGKYIIDEEKALIAVQLAREELYNIGLQVGAMMKHFEYLRLSGQMELIQELDDALGHVNSVKRQLPKPKEVTTETKTEEVTES